MNEILITHFSLLQRSINYIAQAASCICIASLNIILILTRRDIHTGSATVPTFAKKEGKRKQNITQFIPFSCKCVTLISNGLVSETKYLHAIWFLLAEGDLYR